MTTLTLTRQLVTLVADRPTEITITRLAAILILRTQAIEAMVAFVAGVASDVSLAATHASLLVTAQVGDGALSVTRARFTAEWVVFA